MQDTVERGRSALGDRSRLPHKQILFNMLALVVLTVLFVLLAVLGPTAAQAQEGVNQLEALPGTPGPCLIPGNCSIDGGADQGGGSSSPGGGSSFPSGPGTSGQGSCLPNPGGDPSPCGGDGPASQSRLDSGSAAGNPIDLTIGNKYQKEVDLPALPGVLGLEVVRHYNSGYARDRMEPGILGRGWKLSYETKLYRIGKTIQIIQADGARLIFNRDPEHPEQCSTTDARYGRIVIVPSDDSETYQWIWTHGPSAGRRLNFDQHGQLTRIEAPSGEAVELQYHDGLLNRVTDPQGRMLTLDYPSVAEQRDPWLFPGVKRIETPLGEILYTHGREPEELPLPMYREGEPPPPPSVQTEQERVEAKKQQSWKIANLERVEWRPAATDEHPTVKLYHYEDERHSNLLTGISVAGSDGKIERISRYGYDETGLAVLSERFDGSERVELTELVPSGRVGKPGHTVIADGKGNLTNYRHAQIGGRGRIIEARGTGCPGCGESNRRYRYDAIGREVKTIQLDEMGRAESGIRRDYDAWGRLKGIGRVRYGTGTTETVAGQGQFLSNLWRWKKTATQASQAMEQIDWLIRYDYAEPHVDSKTGVLLALEKPMRITRPSVVEGKEHRIELEYNDAWQVTKVIETGYSPAIPTNVAHVEPSIPESTDPADDDGFIKASTASAGLVGWEERSGSQQNSRDNLNSEASVGWAKQAQRSVPTRTAVTNQPEIPTRNTSTNTDGGFVGWEERSGSQRQSAADLVVAKSSGTNISKITLPEGLQGNYVRAKCSGTLDSTGRSDCPRLITRTTEYRYRKVNGRSVLVAIDGPLPNGSNGPLAMPTDSDIIHIFWDKQGNYPVRVFMPSGGTRAFERDAAGRLTRVSPTDGIAVHYRYNVRGQMTYLEQAGRRIDIEYDALGRPVFWKRNDGQSLRAVYQPDRLRYVFADGQSLEAARNSTGVTHVGWFDAQGSPLTEALDGRYRTRSPLIFAENTTVAREADNADDGILRVKQTELDPGHYLLAADQAGAQYHVDKSIDGRFNVLTLPGGGRHVRVLDDFGRTVALESTGLGAEYWTYDAADRPVRMQNALREMTLDYDAAGRLLRRVHRDTGGLEQTVHYRYSGERLEQIESEGQTTAYVYDANGRVVEERITLRTRPGMTDHWVTKTAYDALGRTQSVELPEGVRLYYSYGRTGQLERVDYQAPVGNWRDRLLRSVWSGYGKKPLVGDIETQSAFGVTGFTYSNGERAEAGHDKHGRLHTWHSGTLYDRLDYDERGHLIRQTRNENRERRYDYDRRGRLTEIAGNWETAQRFRFDVNGNREGDGAYRYAYQTDSDRLLLREDAGQQRRYTYNARGEPELIAAATGNPSSPLRRLTYGTRGELLEIHEGNRRVARYDYNHLQQRIAKESGGRHTQYLWHDGLIDAEAENGRIHTRYIYLAQRPIALIRYDGEGRTSLYAIHSDYLGTAQAVSDERQQTVWHIETSIYGQMLSESTAPSSTDFTFHLRLPGHYADRESGFYYNWHRYYDPEQGRYLTPDPIGLFGGPNAYLYADNRPTTDIDLWGLRNLTIGEIGLAESIFSTGVINYGEVQIDELVESMTSRAYVSFGNIKVPRSGGQYQPDYSLAGVSRNDQMMFIHEMTHVWQYYSGVIVDGGESIPLRFIELFGVNPYEYDLDCRKKLRDYNVEQQGFIIQHYFSVMNTPGPQLASQEGEVLDYFDAQGILQTFNNRQEQLKIYQLVLSELLNDPAYLQKEIAKDDKEKKRLDCIYNGGVNCD